MAQILLTSDTLSLHFTRGEKIAGLLRDTEVRRTDVVEAGVVAEGLSAARGLRAPGLALPGLCKIGTWRRHGRRTLVDVRRDEPALHVRLRAGCRWDEILVGSGEAAALAAALSPGAPDGAATPDPGSRAGA